jgi:hypothetical protein
MGFVLANIDTGALSTQADLDGIQNEVDPFGFALPVKLTAGWYYRGENVHHPVWVAVTKDIERMGREITYRYSINKNSFKFMRNIVEDVFNERHPKAPNHFRKNFYHYMMSVMNETVHKTNAGK